MAIAVGCGEEKVKPTASTKPVAAVSGDNVADFAGTWTGSRDVMVRLGEQKTLTVRLQVAPDGSVNGTVGDATLVNAKLQRGRGDLARSLNLGSDWHIHGDLKGDLIQAEQIRRDGIDILFHRDGEGLKGGLHSTGSEFGGKEKMKLSGRGWS